MLARSARELMELVFGDEYVYDALGLVAITVGMGIYLCAATLNQTALAAKRAAQAAVCWVVAAAVFVVWMLLPIVEDPLHRVEIGYPASAIVLFVSLFGLSVQRRRDRTGPRCVIGCV